MEHGCLARMQMTGMRQLAVPGCLMLVTVLALAEVKQKPWTYRASVFAHRPLLPSETFPVSRAIAVKNMMKNVVIYRQQAQHAAKQGAQIIVYPEDGLYGYLFNRVTIKPYLEPIPDPWQVLPWVPCTDPGRVQPSDIMVQLSCIARENKIYLVANMGDIKPCNTTDDVSGIPCPPDGHFQYNTDVVFDPTGRLIARYHKHNLCEEHQFDKPEVEVVTFETPFGRFGLFTCFDILFHDPAILLVENGITNIAFPTFWTEEYPLLNAIGIHSAWARGNRVNLLAANIHMPALGALGSGVYTSDGPIDYYYDDTASSEGRLIVVDVPGVPVTNKREPGLSFNRFLGFGDRDSESTTLRKMDVDVGSAVYYMRAASHVVASSDVFLAEIGGDLFRMVDVTDGSGSRVVCAGRTCCQLTYRMESGARAPAGFYAFGVFEGVHTSERNWYTEVCLLVFCTDPSHGSCGRTPVKEPSAVVSSFIILGRFSTPYVYPEVLVLRNDSLSLTAPGEWNYSEGRLQASTPLSQPLLAASLFARDYSRDP